MSENNESFPLIIDINGLNALDKKIENFVKTNIDSLIQTQQSEYGVFLFPALKSDFIELKFYFQQFNKDLLLLLPEQIIVATIDILRNFFKVFEDRIQNYIVPKGINDSVRASKINDTTTKIQNIIKIDVKPQFNLIIPYSKIIHIEQTIKQNDFESFKDVLNKKIIESEKLINDLRTLKDNVIDIRTTIQDELKQIGLGAHTKIFNEDAEKHCNRADKLGRNVRNLIIGTLLSILVILVVFLIFSKDWSTRQIIEISAISAIIISILTYSITVVLKSYFAEKHLQTANQHKANVLGTFLTLVNLTNENTASNLLEQAINTIFTPPATGYINKENEVQNPNPIVNIVDGLSKKFE